MSLAEPIAIMLEVVAVLEDLGIEYVVGGSLASSMHGIPRSTNVLDLVVVLPGRLVDPLIGRLKDRFYIDREMILDAIARRASFKIIHLETLFKVDLFVFDQSELSHEELRRRQAIELGEPPRSIWLASPEDIVLQKLVWYEKGARVSDRQWGDLRAVLQVQGERLDLGYIRRWARTLGLMELAERALGEAGLPKA